MSDLENQKSYKEGDRVRVKATGAVGVVRSGSIPASRSVGMKPAKATFAIDVHLDGSDYAQQFTHEDVERIEQ